MARSDRSSKIRTRRGFLQMATGGLLASSGLPFLRAADIPPAPKGRGGVVVLDDCDPVFKDKPVYADHLSLFDAAGKLTGRVTGLNICEEIGSPHRMAVDVALGRIWLAETVGKRLLQYTFDGREALSLPDVKASSLAVDPVSRHVWVARSSGHIGSGHLDVYDQRGKPVAAYEAHGFDMVYDPLGKAFWLVDTDLIKISPDGKALVRKRITDWCGVSVATDTKTGRVWVATRQHSPGLGKNALLCFDNEGGALHTIELGDRAPFRVAVDSADGMAWVTIISKSLQLYTSEGKLHAEHAIPALAADLDPRTGRAWVATSEEVLQVDRKGEILTRARHPGKTTQAWISTY